MSTIEPISIELSLDFKFLAAAKHAIGTFVVNRGKSFRIFHSDRKHYVVICYNAFYKFLIRTTVLQGPRVKVTRYISHSCSSFTHLNFRQAHSVSFIVE
jgi:hypothetical protein